MTEDDRLREQGLMVEERRRLRAELACLQNRSRRIEIALERAATAVRQPHVRNWEIDDAAGALVLAAPDLARPGADAPGPLSYPTLEELTQYLTERQAIGDRLAELDKLLSI